MKTDDIKNLLINEIQKGNIKETGYVCPSGLEYVEIRNALFEVDKPYIFDKIKSYDRVTSDWYKINYDPLLYKNDQFIKFIHKLGNNPLTRQAVLFMGLVDEYDNGNDMICTMYMHVFLNKIENDNYTMDYVVHMRSNDAIEFGNDIQWHLKLIDKISKFLYSLFYINIIDTKIIWNADSLQVYKEYFNVIN